RVALTATADEATRREIVARLSLDEARVFVASFDRPNIRYRIAGKDEPRKQLLRFIRDEHANDCGIVYCLSRKSVEETAAQLAANGVDAMAYHAGLTAQERSQRQERFIDGSGVVMVATIAFGMGIDKPDVRFVAHLDMPRSVEGYYQETGRAGRDGLPADAWMVYGLADVVQQRRLIEQSDGEETFRRVANAKLDAMLGLCETVDCRRQQLLTYFGETSAPCGNCDTCLQPPDQFDGTEAAQKLLSCIYRCEKASGFAFGAQQVIDVLRGKRSDKVVARGHESLSTFGIGTDLDEAQWRAVLRQLVAMRLVAVDHDHWNVLRLAPASREVLTGARRLTLRRDPVAASGGARQRRRDRARAEAPAMAPQDEPLFHSLREWRRGIASEHGVPAYTVFHDATLREIAARRPTDVADLAGISGIGATKLARYGDALVAVLRADARKEATP
ncbi:RecQ family ATP-dependent DNA helicase, partial [bacterium]